MEIKCHYSRIVLSLLEATEWDRRRWRATEWSEAVLCRKRREGEQAC